MKKNILTLLAAILALTTLTANTYANKEEGIVRKVYIRSADPLLIAMILSGKYTFDMSPEPTSLARLGSNNFGNGQFGGQGNSFGGSSGGFGGGGFGGGRGGRNGG